MPEMSNDEVLEYLVQKVEETAIGFSVTLNVNGLVIVGEPIRSELYYDHLSRLFDTYTEKSEGGRREKQWEAHTHTFTECRNLGGLFYRTVSVQVLARKDIFYRRILHRQSK